MCEKYSSINIETDEFDISLKSLEDMATIILERYGMNGDYFENNIIVPDNIFMSVFRRIHNTEHRSVTVKDLLKEREDEIDQAREDVIVKMIEITEDSEFNSVEYNDDYCGVEECYDQVELNEEL